MSLNESEWVWMSLSESEWVWMSLTESDLVWMSLTESEWVSVILRACQRIVRIGKFCFMIEIGDTAVNIVRNCIPMRNCLLRERLWSESHFRLVNNNLGPFKTHFGLTIRGSNMHIFSVIAFRSGKFWLWSTCMLA